MPGKRWTKEEVGKLYQYAEQASQAEAAIHLNRSYHSVRKKASRLGIVWLQGFASFQDIANLSGVSRQSVSRVIREMYPSESLSAGRGKKPRTKIPLDDVDKVVKKVREKFGNGYWSLSKVARAVGCDKGTVRRLVEILYHDKEMFYVSGKMKVYRIVDRDAERLIKILNGTRVIRKHNIAGGKASRAKK